MTMIANTSTNAPAIEEMLSAELANAELPAPRLGVGVYVPLDGNVVPPPVANPGIVEGTVRTPLITHRLRIVELLTRRR
jgi:hypothetical protein